MRYVTIKDVADALGISKSSVSRALAGDMRNVSPSTIERVRAKALEMGYRRNMTAVNLQGQGQQDYRDNSAGNHNTLFDGIRNYGAGRRCSRSAIRCLLLCRARIRRVSVRILICLRMAVSTVFSYRSRTTWPTATILKNLVKSNFPIVFFDRTIRDLQCSSVCSNDGLMSFFLVGT